MSNNLNPKGSSVAPSASASSLPANFQSPFKRVAMKERMDDAFACIATLTGKSLDEVNRAAVSFGYPSHGPAYPTETLIAKLLMSLGNLVATHYKDFESLAVLPEVAILFIDWDEEMDTGRTVVWHKVRKTDTQPSFSYVIDPASWVDDTKKIHADIASLKITWFMGISPARDDRPGNKTSRRS